MWVDSEKKLTDHLLESSTIEIDSLIIAEWNMNSFEDIENYGTYKLNRSSNPVVLPLNTYDKDDSAGYWRDADRSYYTYGTFVTNNDQPSLFLAPDTNRKLFFDLKQCFDPFRPRSGINKVLYFQNSFIDNVKSATRPRYYMSTKYDNFKYWNSFKTQSSGTTVDDLGVSNITNAAGDPTVVGYEISDACPFVVYDKAFPANRIVTKIQTNLAKNSIGTIKLSDGTTITDPLADRTKSTIPKKWRIEYLDEKNNWITAYQFRPDEKRIDGSEIFIWDGYVELAYGVKVPEKYRGSFHFVAYLDDLSSRPPTGLNTGESYIIGLSSTTNNTPGTLHIWDAATSTWYTEAATYGFSICESDDTEKVGIIQSLTDPKYYLASNVPTFTELVFMRGLRIVVETMLNPEKTFNLIELSPRLRADVSSYVISFETTKSTGNDQTQLPVGGLLASTGTVNLMNYDDAFTFNNYDDTSYTGLFSDNTGSLVSRYLKPNVKFDFYEIVLNVNGYDKYIPMQSMYAEVFPTSTGGMNEISISLRDQFFRFESTRATDIFLTDCTLTSAVTILLDSCGFSNYIYKGFDDLRDISLTTTNDSDYPTYYPPIQTKDGNNNTIQYVNTSPYIDSKTGLNVDINSAWEIYWNLSKQYNFTPVSTKITTENKKTFYDAIEDPVIPYFFVGPDISVAQALANLAAATQTAMFFDEYNNFVVMPKEYFMPDPNSMTRKTDLMFLGQTRTTKLPNIISIGSTEEQIINSGSIKYSIKYIQRVYSKLSQAQYSDQDKVFVYKPVLLWEVGSNTEARASSDQKGQTSGYALSAVPLNIPLNASAPYVENNQVINNIIDVGESAMWIGRFQGYFYANSEIIRYDAVEYSIAGRTDSEIALVGRNPNTVWITSNREYQKYFSKLKFGGKMYQTGKVRIFSEPFYETIDKTTRIKNGAVERHGRGQFGTDIVEHPASLSDYWSSSDNLQGCVMDTSKLFTMTPIERITPPTQGSTTASVGVRKDLALLSTRNGIIKNFLRASYPKDKEIKTLSSTTSGTVQSSALVFTGPRFSGSAALVDDIDPAEKIIVKPIDFISYVYKPLDAAFRHFGTRMRIIGKYNTDQDKVQTANSGSTSTTYYTVPPSEASEKANIDGGSGGIAIGLNPATNHGYFFEICALSGRNIQQYNQINEDTGKFERVLHNVMFYKVYNSGEKAVANKLWGGIASIIVDEGNFVGQDRIGIQDKPTVYDLSVEYQDIGSIRRFYLYINNKQVGYVDDPNPLPKYTNMALFTRGQSECMFENVYALQSFIASNSQETVITEINDAFGDDTISTSEAMRKYSVSGFIKSTYLSGIGSTAPKYKIYVEEFGTILRECAYFNIRYDQAYPALIAKLAPTFGSERGYSVSQFRASAYGAEFLIFNTTDKAISIDETTGNYLRILGVTFTQDTTGELTVDDYFKRSSNFSDPQYTNSTLTSPLAERKKLESIERSRKKYGKKEFNIESEYIQSDDDASKLMGWIMGKALRQRQKIVMEVFGVPVLQLGDIVSIDYDIDDNIHYVDKTKRFVVQGISHSKSATDRSTQITVVEI